MKSRIIQALFGTGRILSLRAGALSAACALAAVTVSSDAQALPKSCTVNTVQYDEDGRLVLWCEGDSNVYYGFSYQPAAQTTCTVNTKDTVKVWVSLLQAALLSGRPVSFEYDATKTGCNLRMISWGMKLHK
jgi:Fe-S cluster assembly iron-binding protein IscA